ncbi:MAG: biotin transporter BioY [Clostridioides sp.]|jgi:biotin transport system substrate-specific component|nr:biotin transporter BioY [Clostridioides sp.]
MKINTRDLTICAIFASLTAILSQISIPLPFTVVPLTMQIFAVGLAGIMLGGRRAFISLLLYVFIGAIGLPVFAGMKGGIGTVLGPTGGFILGFPLMALIVGYFSDKFSSNKMNAIGLLLGLLLDYGLGVAVFMFVTDMNIIQSLTACVIPFVPLDLVKIAMVSVIGAAVERRVNLKSY